MNKDVFSFDDFLNKNDIKKIAPKTSLKDEFLKDEEEREEEEVKPKPSSLVKESLEEDNDSDMEELDDVIEIEDTEEQIVDDTEDDYYKLYQDKNEEFTCEIKVEGSSTEDTWARIILESENWSLVFPGEIKNGKCIVPIRKLNILKEGEVGSIKLEVVAEGSLFIPWESQFKVKLSKKVTVNVNESKKNNIKKSQIPGKIDVKVKVK